MNAQLKSFICRLRKPSTIISIISQVLSILLLLGIRVDQSLIMSIAAAGCSILVAFGILSNPDTVKKGFGDDIYPCSSTGDLEKHLMVNDQMVCQVCGSIYKPPETPSETSSETTADANLK
ncbi:MAG: hypothetical protein LBR74_05770 [Eubacterium sp.]|jgi:uncharacterized membrane protein|nr:hypothetical protein [Eubacterium sp.]